MKRSARPPALNLQPAKVAVEESFARAKIDELYELGATLGAGSSAVIYKARRRSDGFVVALKSYHTCEEEEIRALAKKEYDIMRSMQHPSILAAEEAFDLPTAVWVRMEFCENGSLDKFVEKNGVCSEQHTRKLCRQLLQGLDFLHGKRIVHRDIKPDNLLLKDEGWTLKIGDFGSAKRISSGSAMLTHRGTQLFCAPELYFAQVRSRYSWNERVDLWSSGMCLYFMSDGRIPFNIGLSNVAQSLKAGLLPPIDWEHSLSVSWQAVIKMCLTVDPSQRPPALALLQSPFLMQDAELEQRTATDPEQSIGIELESPSSSTDTSHWRESRTSIECLRRVARHMSRQTSDEISKSRQTSNEFVKTSSSSSCDTGPTEENILDEVNQIVQRKVLKGPCRTKFKTTHGALFCR
eukprot:TRINITY_DN6642_c0_g2_i1.p1 TRINITY_DN6642_c0_g2~~TRINITY_DN6642_c0_g2_i1.p1  ORF type:complete len:408 (-),score=57.58 TRINITY_DN6642_c0_g2_i1:54-1277(-)